MQNPIKNVLTKCKYLLHLESSLEPEERAEHQWQMLCKRGDVQYIFGKGGANTCFIIIDGERELYYPDEFLKKIEHLAKQKYTAYGIYCSSKQKLLGTWPLLETARRKIPKRSTLSIVGIDDSGNNHEVYYASKTLSGFSWVRTKTKE